MAVGPGDWQTAGDLQGAQQVDNLLGACWTSSWPCMQGAAVLWSYFCKKKPGCLRHNNQWACPKRKLGWCCAFVLGFSQQHHTSAAARVMPCICPLRAAHARCPCAVVTSRGPQQLLPHATAPAAPAVLCAGVGASPQGAAKQAICQRQQGPDRAGVGRQHPALHLHHEQPYDDCHLCALGW